MLDWYDLNARHEATILWVASVLVVAFATSHGTRGAISSILRTLLRPSISLLIIGLLVNVATLSTAAVVVGRNVGFWETIPVVTATIWFLTAGFSLLFNLDEFVHTGRAFLRRAVAVLGPSTVVAEVVGVGVLVFWWELFLIPVLFLLTFAVFRSRSTGLIVLSTCFLLTYAVGLISLVAIELANDPGNWRSVAQVIIFPAVLTIGTLPYIRLLIEMERIIFRLGVKSKTVKSIDYGQDWPLTVDSAKLCCKFKAVWVEVNGRRYGVNGTAKGLLKKYGYVCLDLNDIWRDHPDRERWIQGSGGDSEAGHWKVPIHRLIQDGFALERK